MKYRVRQRVFSLADRFDIEDESGRACFTVSSQFFSLGRKLELQPLGTTGTASSAPIQLRQKLLSFLPQYVMLRSGSELANIQQELSILKPRFRISSSLGVYSIEGNFLAYDFTVRKADKAVATISKAWFTFSDSYGVDVAEGEDAAFILALVVVIDQILHSGNK
jgi:uncharacterized protein YxjI